MAAITADSHKTKAAGILRHEMLPAASKQAVNKIRTLPYQISNWAMRIKTLLQLALLVPDEILE